MADPVEDKFLSQLRERPTDDDVRLVYADWLEERARQVEGQFLRLQVKIASLAPEDPQFVQASNALRDLAGRVAMEWRTRVARAQIENCDVRFDFSCPKKWEALEATGLGDDVRFCGSCQMNVYYSQTVDEARRHAEQGRCVVLDLVPLRVPGDLRPRPPIPSLPTAGMPIVPPSHMAEPEPEPAKKKRWWPF